MKHFREPEAESDTANIKKIRDGPTKIFSAKMCQTYLCRNNE